jgi:putative transposase
VNLFRFIDVERACLPVALLCCILGISQQLLRLEIQVTIEAKLRGRDLTAKIHEIHRRSRETYGSPRIHAQLSALGTRCGRKRVERLMQQAGLQGCMRGSRKGTTRRRKRALVEDLVKRYFAAPEVDRVWVADITYVATQEGFLYLAVILDAHSRRIVG